MVKLMNLNQLVKIAGDAGIFLEPVTPESENIYVYAVDVEKIEEQHTVYVGRSTDRSRSVTETNVQGQDYVDRIGVGFSALIVENDAKRHSFRFEPATFDPAPILDQIDRREWEGRSIAKLKELLTDHSPESPAFSRDDIETFLIRVHINTGRLIGNSAFASQWEATVGRLPNVAAVLAADIARHNDTLPWGTGIAAVPDTESHDVAG